MYDFHPQLMESLTPHQFAIIQRTYRHAQKNKILKLPVYPINEDKADSLLQDFKSLPKSIKQIIKPFLEIIKQASCSAIEKHKTKIDRTFRYDY